MMILYLNPTSEQWETVSYEDDYTEASKKVDKLNENKKDTKNRYILVDIIW